MGTDCPGLSSFIPENPVIDTDVAGTVDKDILLVSGRNIVFLRSGLILLPGDNALAKLSCPAWPDDTSPLPPALPQDYKYCLFLPGISKAFHA